MAPELTLAENQALWLVEQLSWGVGRPQVGMGELHCWRMLLYAAGLDNGPIAERLGGAGRKYCAVLNPALGILLDRELLDCRDRTGEFWPTALGAQLSREDRAEPERARLLATLACLTDQLPGCNRERLALYAELAWLATRVRQGATGAVLDQAEYLAVAPLSRARQLVLDRALDQARAAGGTSHA